MDTSSAPPKEIGGAAAHPSPSPATGSPTFIDSHVHIDYVMEKMNAPLSSLNEFMEEHFGRASDNRWEGSVHVVCDVEKFNHTSLQIIEHPKLVGAFGVHPHEAKNWNAEIEKQLLEWMKNPKVRAWGEMGLDYHYDNSPRDVQKEVFAKQLQLAVSVKKPVVVHTREAEEDTLLLMKRHLPVDWPIHVHCFTSSTDLASKLLAHFTKLYIGTQGGGEARVILTCLTGFTGVITFRTAEDVRRVVELVPLDRILLETDGPFMAPLPFRGKTATSGMIPYTAQKIADVKKTSLEAVLRAARQNTRVVYNF